MDNEIQRILNLHNQVYDMMMILLTEQDKLIEQQKAIIEQLFLELEKKKKDKKNADPYVAK